MLCADVAHVHVKTEKHKSWFGNKILNKEERLYATVDPSAQVQILNCDVTTYSEMPWPNTLIKKIKLMGQKMNC